MLYKYSVAVLLLSTLLWSACDDEANPPANDDPQAEITFGSDTLLELMYCGPDYTPTYSYFVHVADTAGAPLANVGVYIFITEPMEIIPPSDSFYVTNAEGNVEFELTCDCFGTVEITAICLGDTSVQRLHIQYHEGILGAQMVPVADTLFDRQELPDSMEIFAQLSYDLGFPSWRDSTRFSSSAGYIDSSYHAYGNEGYDYINVYWYPTESVDSGLIVLYAETKTYCGGWPNHFVEEFLHDTTSFILAPAP